MNQNQNQNVSLDRKLVVSLLEKLLSLTEESNRDQDHVKDLESQLNLIIKNNNLDKEQLVTRWVQISGKDIFDHLKPTTLDEYFKILPVIFKSSSEYLNKTGDYLYMVAELVIATDWVLYQSINMDI